MEFQGLSSPTLCSEPGHLRNQTRFFKALATRVLKTQGWRLLTVMLVGKKVFFRPSQNLLFQLTLSHPSSMPSCEGPGSIFPVTCSEAPLGTPRDQAEHISPGPSPGASAPALTILVALLYTHSTLSLCCLYWISQNWSFLHVLTILLIIQPRIL